MASPQVDEESRNRDVLIRILKQVRKDEVDTIFGQCAIKLKYDGKWMETIGEEGYNELTVNASSSGEFVCFWTRRTYLSLAGDVAIGIARKIAEFCTFIWENIEKFTDPNNLSKASSIFHEYIKPLLNKASA